MKKRMQRIKLGQITAPVGIKGEIRVYPYLDQARFSDIEKVCVGDKDPVALERVRPDKNMLVMKLAGIDDRNASEMLRGKDIYLPEGVSIDLGKDSYFIEDLIGMNVQNEDGVLLGVIKDVISRPAQDIYEVEKADGRSFMMPAVRDFILNVDTDGKTMTVRLPEGLTEL